MAEFDWDKPQSEVPAWDKPSVAPATVAPKPSTAQPSTGQGAYRAAAKSLAEETGGLVGMGPGAAMGAEMFAPLGLPGILGGGILGGGLGYFGGSDIQKQAGKLVPTGVKEFFGFSPEQRSEEKRQHPTASFVGGTVVPIVAGGSPLVQKAYRAIKSPSAITEVKDAVQIGEKGFDFLKDKASKLYADRATEASKLYEDAFTAARQRQAQGIPFGSSAQGKSLIAELEADKQVLAGSEAFAKGEEKVKGIDRLINAIKGTETGGMSRVAKETPAGKKIYTVSGTPKKTTQKDVEALVEELRFLRDVDAKGKPYEAYAALDGNYKRDLIGKLEKQLYDWAPEYEAADKAYKAASQKLTPFKTELMSRALKGEKFDPKDLVKSPEEFGPTFFKDVNSVENLLAATESPAQVASLGKEYVASVFAQKTPTQIQSFVQTNAGWLKKAGIYDDVANYAFKATTAQNRQDILKKLAVGTAVAGLGALGSGMYMTQGRPFINKIFGK